MSHFNVEIRVTTLACLVVLMAGRAHSEEPPGRFQVTTRKAEDRVTVGLHGDGAIFTVTSPSGIGGATITRAGERWPGSIILRLHLRGLERLRIGNGKVTLSASVSSSGDHQTILALSEGGKDEVPIDRSSPYWTEISILNAQGHPAKEIRLKDGVFEVTLPHALFVSNPPTITLDWIDFYR
jgi:hypothetical protein